MPPIMNRGKPASQRRHNRRNWLNRRPGDTVITSGSGLRSFLLASTSPLAAPALAQAPWPIFCAETELYFAIYVALRCPWELHSVLVGCGLCSANGFYVRSDLVSSHFTGPFTPERLFNPLVYDMIVRFPAQQGAKPQKPTFSQRLRRRFTA